MAAASSSSTPKVVKNSFLKKYIYYAKNRIRPVLSKRATDYIVNEYTSLRNDKEDDHRKKVGNSLDIQTHACPLTHLLDHPRHGSYA
jgi:DNA replicative helicase MCM subunit Mcm2 (Cdc46/Mcm family)